MFVDFELVVWKWFYFWFDEGVIYDVLKVYWVEDIVL